MLNSAAVEERGGPEPTGGAREQPRDPEQEQQGQNHIYSKKRGAPAPLGQMSTLGD
ncbi:MAG: hypothetical protein GY696_15270 [Gammaproteobacteria bacterium]|nr:hypothetical protein [Gammaproteobacteria bacterium]